jgi:hypothetical protein
MGALLSIGIKGKDGKYKNYTISISDTPDKYGQNVSMFAEQTPEERSNKTPKNYIGNGKVFWTDGKISVPVKEVVESNNAGLKPNTSFIDNLDEFFILKLKVLLGTSLLKLALTPELSVPIRKVGELPMANALVDLLMRSCPFSV